MSKVLFSHSYFYKLDPKQWRFHQPYPPLGTLQAAAVIRRADFDVSFFDTGLADGPEKIGPVLKKEKPDYFILYDDGFNYLTKMCLSVMREAAFVMTSLAKREGCPVIINSSDSTDHFEKYFDHGVDYVIRGEGEKTLEELLVLLEKKEPLENLMGLAYRKNGKTVVTPPRPVLRDLDELPMPAWDLVDMESYRRIWMKHHGYFSINLATTRGCPYKCNWCAKPIYGNRYNSRSPQNVLDEIDFLLKNYRPDHFWMCDDIFGLKPGWVQQFKMAVKERNMKFRYKIQSRVDLLQKNVVAALAESGVETVWVGAESGSQKILDAMDKGTTVPQIYDATKQLKQMGVNVAFFLQFGYPGETREDIDATLNMVMDLMPDEIGISVSYPLPGTKFYDRVKNDLQEKQNWKDSDDLAMLYRSSFPPAYYKILHRYVHSRYRIRRGVNQLKAWRFHKLKSIASMIYHMPLSMIHSYRLHQIHHATN